MYGLVEKLKPREYSQLGAINTRSGSTHILKDLSSYGSSIGGASLDGTTGIWFVMYSKIPSDGYEIFCSMVQINLADNSSYPLSVNVSESYCPWGIAWSETNQVVYGVSWNVRLGLQEVVIIDPTTGTTSLLTELPKKYGNIYGNSRLASLDDINGIFYVVLDGYDYVGQYLYAINVTTGDYKDYTLNADDSEWIVTSMTWDSQLDCFVGIGYKANRGWWEFIHVSSTGRITAVHHFDDATTNYIYEYNIFWLDEASQDYYLLVSDFNQKDWYIYTFDAKTGFVIGKSFQLSCDGGVPNNECIPNHLTMY
eukprot:CAMPEP_0201509684 /NCGR_PEP_ID=MMETSP0161_2-20130828/2661_1 /ASSEMBLY_ACC=CAM_ASM_000251 /TAXON_ID=180227 /ORGANISM="Neoparamoeba aestuarina, Strain SoJaBio B1-5/56/2" /LENGTH=309 /DNA_ID=CAMNT_0047904707 /DNA_START=105 /DNA_END=1034 /DNA_ORIENTATION=-